jgi:hypothetical protein
VPIISAPSRLATRSERIKCALKDTGLTMAHLSALTAERYGRASPYFIPPTLLYKLTTGVAPHVCQIAALSILTCYRFTDWMTAFGFDLAQIPRLQVTLHRDYTVLLTPVEANIESRTSSRGALGSFTMERTSPGQEEEKTGSISRYIYAKIGTTDMSVFPELLPGSVVRVDTRANYSKLFSVDASRGPICLVEHLGGLTCCRVKRVDDRHVVLLSSHSANSSLPLRLGQEARIFGLIDSALVPTRATQTFKATSGSGIERPDLDRNPQNVSKLSEMLQISRKRSRLTFRSAHEISLQVARAMGDRHYAIAIGLLSDYETTDKPPRHTAKIMTLCILYGIDFFQYLRCADVQYDDSPKSSLFQAPVARSERGHSSVSWATNHTTLRDFPPSLVGAQNEMTTGRIAM